MNRKISIHTKQKSYDVLVGAGLLNQVGDEIWKIFRGASIAIITDDNVNEIYGQILKKQLKAKDYNVVEISIKPGEENKNQDNLNFIYEALIENNISREDMIITLGGGMIGDLGGYAAATYQRGIALVHIPTTLLAQVDSSIGGKVGINLEQGKNMIGAFYQPSLVITDTDLLSTLSEEIFCSAIPEIIKYGVIRDVELLETLENAKNLITINKNIIDIVCSSINIKKEFIEADENDRDQRMLLNFGHTLGHAIEKAYNYKAYSHGEAVGIGMYMITSLSERLGITQEGSAQRIKNVLVKYKLPYETSSDNMEDIINQISYDKKRTHNIIKVICLKKIGEAFVHKTTISFFRK